MESNHNRLFKVLTDIRTWKIAGVVSIIIVVLDIVFYGAFITCEGLQNKNDTSFTNFNSIPANLYVAHHNYEMHNLKLGINVKQAQIMNNSCDKNGVKHIQYNPKTAKLEVEFNHQPNLQQRLYAQKLVKTFNK